MAKKTKAGLIQPIIKVDGENHILQDILDGEPDAMPEITSVGYAKIIKGDNRNAWVSYTLKTKGREVLSMEVDEPNVKAIAEESAKIAFVTQFVDKEVEF